MLNWDGGYEIENMEGKNLLLLRIKRQDSSSLSKQIYEESLSNGWPGLGEEVADICKEIGIADVNKEVVTKENISDAIYNHHYCDLKKELENSKKLKHIKHEDFSKVQE